MAAALLSIGASVSVAQQESLFLDAPAYNPIPSPDGKYVAYVVTGRKHKGGSGGLGRSNLRSDLWFAGADGKNAQDSGDEGFIGEWLPKGDVLLSYRDWHFNVVGPAAKGESGFFKSSSGDSLSGERVGYLSSQNSSVWIDQGNGQTLLESKQGKLATLDASLPVSSVIVPSPDGRFLAVGSTGRNSQDSAHLWILDTKQLLWTDLGPFTIHPDPEWDFIKPSWNPWFADGKHLTFFSEDSLIVTAPDGSGRRVLLHARNAGLATPSKDGQAVAYATFIPRSRDRRPDLMFWGGTTLWVTPTHSGVPKQVTGTSTGETFDLRWLNGRSLIFDRIGEAGFNADARIWTVPVAGR